MKQNLLMRKAILLRPQAFRLLINMDAKRIRNVIGNSNDKDAADDVDLGIRTGKQANYQSHIGNYGCGASEEIFILRERNFSGLICFIRKAKRICYINFTTKGHKVLKNGTLI